jgi:hypothetical protein
MRMAVTGTIVSDAIQRAQMVLARAIDVSRPGASPLTGMERGHLSLGIGRTALDIRSLGGQYMAKVAAELHTDARSVLTAGRLSDSLFQHLDDAIGHLNGRLRTMPRN